MACSLLSFSTACLALAARTSSLIDAPSHKLAPVQKTAPPVAHAPQTTRRALFGGAAALVAASPANALQELPQTVRKYTALAPLGPADRQLGGAKRICLSDVLPECLPQLAAILGRDLERGSTGRGGYPVTGDLSPEIFRDDCRFLDPTNDVTSLAKYQKALTILFDPGASSVRLVTAPVADEARRTISATVRSEGVLQLPWRPKIAPWESYLTWRVDGDGLIYEQAQTWNITSGSALRQTFAFF